MKKAPTHRLADRVLWALGRSSQHAQRLVRQHMTQAGVRTQHYHVLASLADDGEAAQATLADRIGFDRSDLVTLLDIRATRPLPRFPSIVRDLSILVADTLPASQLRGTIRSVAPPTLARVAEFDRYQGKGIPDGQVSLSYRLTFLAPDRTLTDAEVDAAMSAIVGALGSAHGAVRR